MEITQSTILLNIKFSPRKIILFFYLTYGLQLIQELALEKAYTD